MKIIMIVDRAIDGKKVYVNVDNICAVYPKYQNEETTIIQFAGGVENYIEVRNSTESIALMMRGNQNEQT